MDICDKKNQIQDLLNDIFSEYNRINETKIQSKCETDLEMRTMISNIRSLESSSIEKDNRIKCLEKTVCDYEKIIEDLNSRLELKEECDRENNRHDMLRTLSKDISEKDREIKRLNDLLEFHKKEKSKSKEDNKKQKIDNIIGIIYAKDLLTIDHTLERGSIQKFMREAIFIPETKPFAERNTLGKKQSLDFGIKCYEAGIRDAQRGKTSASR